MQPMHGPSLYSSSWQAQRRCTSAETPDHSDTRPCCTPPVAACSCCLLLAEPQPEEGMQHTLLKLELCKAGPLESLVSRLTN